MPAGQGPWAAGGLMPDRRLALCLSIVSAAAGLFLEALASDRGLAATLPEPALAGLLSRLAGAQRAAVDYCYRAATGAVRVTLNARKKPSGGPGP